MRGSVIGVVPVSFRCLFFYPRVVEVDVYPSEAADVGEGASIRTIYTARSDSVIGSEGPFSGRSELKLHLRRGLHATSLIWNSAVTDSEITSRRSCK